MEGFCLASMVPVDVAAETDGDVELMEAVAMDDASNRDVDGVNAEPLGIEVVAISAVVASGTYLLIVAERSYQLDCFSTDSKVHRKFLPLALRSVTPERALEEVAKTLTNAEYSLLEAVVPTEVDLSATAWR